MEAMSKEEKAWLSEVSDVRAELENHKKSRNYYEKRRRQTQKRLEELLARHPNQMRIEMTDDE